MTAAPAIEIYTRPFCGYCARAVGLFEQKGLDYREIEAGFDPDLRREMIQRAGGASTFPQIFVGGQHIGGCDELMALERAGKFDAMLNV